ncbi:APC family permease [Alicyclobacillus pomorum]|jgi:amino acid transporter|uniref:APC family permease n=1 Tax=Alicyclobacillus pomorum TaxID=204470 RepID=UPI00041838DA|nr:APC family permease [Alicyclobacillus pomorum]
MEGQGKFRKQLTLVDLTFLGLGSIIGSGWLFASAKVANTAGPAAWISWLIGAVAVILLGLVYAELGGSIPRAGGTVRYPVYSHGPLIGYLMGFASLIAFSSVAGIEVEAARQYLGGWVPGLTADPTTGHPTVLGWFVQLAFLVIFFLLNYWSVKVFGKANTIITAFKFIVPIITVIVLLTSFHGANFSVKGFAPFGFSGIETAVSTAGIVFAFLGFQQAVGFSSEAKNPQRTVPVAIILAVLLSAGLYILLQLAFVGGIPTSDLAGGWGTVKQKFNLPFRDIALVLGFGWLAGLITFDAIVSPNGTGNIYLSATSRVIFGWARNGTFFKVFGKVDERTGVPRAALWLGFFASLFWTLPFPSWDAMVSVVSSATVLTYIVGPISAHAFRYNAPDLARPFYLKGMGIISPLAFIIASEIIYWTGWKTDSWLLGSMLVMFVLYLIFSKSVPKGQVSLAQQVKSSWWLIVYFAIMIVLSYFGTFEGTGAIRGPWDQIVVALISVVVYYWGVKTALPRAVFDVEHVEGGDVIAAPGSTASV